LCTEPHNFLTVLHKLHTYVDCTAHVPSTSLLHTVELLPDSAGKSSSDGTHNLILNEYAGKHTASCKKIIASSGIDTFVPAYPHDENDGGSDVHCHSLHKIQYLCTTCSMVASYYIRMMFSLFIILLL